MKPWGMRSQKNCEPQWAQMPGVPHGQRRTNEHPFFLPVPEHQPLPLWLAATSWSQSGSGCRVVEAGGETSSPGLSETVWQNTSERIPFRTASGFTAGWGWTCVDLWKSVCPNGRDYPLKPLRLPMGVGRWILQATIWAQAKVFGVSMWLTSSTGKPWNSRWTPHFQPRGGPNPWSCRCMERASKSDPHG